MQSALDIKQIQLELLKTLELGQICRIISSIIASDLQSETIGIVLYDQDFECLSEKHRFAFGKNEDALLEFFEALDPEMAGGISAMEALEVPASLAPLNFYCIGEEAEPVAIVVAAGNAALTSAAIGEMLGAFPVQEALKNGYEVAELQDEVNRLRAQYESLEHDYHEEKKLNSQIGLKHSALKMEHSDKERLVYEISNAVRSSLDAREVLSTAVSKIGKAFKLSRCQVIWPIPESDEYLVFEYDDESVPSVKDLFFTEAGKEFVRIASSKTAPHDFNEGGQDTFDAAFAAQFGILSGMLVPLMYGERNIGSLFLQDCASAREWSIDNTALIGSLADLITVAIEHANMHEEKKRQAVTDAMTGISNRRHFNDTFVKEFDRARRYGYRLSLVIVDLDFLKKINDTFGHSYGDEAIKAIALVLGKSCRSVDTAARFGGEEFCLLLPDTDETDALRLAERVRKLINETFIEGPGYISASIGVATYPKHASTQEELFEAADQALYAAKQGGRNRVCAAAMPTK